MAEALTERAVAAAVSVAGARTRRAALLTVAGALAAAGCGGGDDRPSRAEPTRDCLL